ncbi:hypothetical protein D3C72_2011840 [compost metagenome]
MSANPLPLIFADEPRYSPVVSAINRNSVDMPLIAYTCPPRLGIQNEFIGASEVIVKLIGVFSGIINSLTVAIFWSG